MTGYFLNSGKGEETRVCHGCGGTGEVPDREVPDREVEEDGEGRGNLMAILMPGGRWEIGKLRGK